jgi:hypothetical protein
LANFGGWRATSLTKGGMKCSIIERGGKMVNRFEFESFEDLEQYFLNYLVGKQGVASKVIGNVLLWWER